MKLLTCHIENFGKLSNLTIDFASTLHLINKPNGWGKSTLATFIKVMFFGFENETKRNALENERKKYSPWQKGIYGGQLTFQVTDKIYTITRTFGAKEKEDTFTLYNTNTNIESNDYSTNIGEELFKIDQESFNRTIYIGQNNISTNSTDSINAKIGNLAENTDDINNYEVVKKRFIDLLNGLSPTRKTGTLKQIEEKIATAEQRIREGSTIDTSIDVLNQKLSSTKTKKETLKIEQNEIHNKLQLIIASHDIKTAKNKYDWLCLQYQKALETQNKSESVFPKSIPKDTQVEKITDDVNQLVGYQSAMNVHTLTDHQAKRLNILTEQFSQHIPTKETLESYKEKFHDYSTLQIKKATTQLGVEDENKLKKLTLLFQNKQPTIIEIDQHIDLWNQRTAKKNTLEPNRVTLNTLKNIANTTTPPNKNKQQSTTSLLLFGILAIALGCLGLLVNQILGIIVICIGIALTLASFILKPRETSRNIQPLPNTEPTNQSLQALQKEIADNENYIQQIENNLRQFFWEYNLQYDEHKVIPNLYELKTHIQEFEKLQITKQQYDTANSDHATIQLETELKEFLMLYFPIGTINSANYLNYLQKLEENIKEYHALNTQLDNFNNAKSFFDLSHSKIVNFIRELGFEVEKNLTQQLQKIQNNIHSLTISKDAALKAQQEKEAFEKEYPIDTFKELQISDDSKSTEELTKRHSDITSLLEEITETISNYIKQIDALQIQRADIHDEEEQLILLIEEKKHLEHHYNILVHTKELLEKAKESFTARYMKPIMKGFTKYYECLMTPQHTNEYKINANITITAKEQGEQRDTKTLSVGFQDLINLCMRMALIDAMFQHEKPFIIVDDSFVNFDNEKVQGGLKFLSEISKEYQVIYFTCHDSREILTS